MDQITALIESSRALSGVLALVLASTPPGELSTSEMDALTDLSYKIHLNLEQLDEIWVQVGDEYRRASVASRWRPLLDLVHKAEFAGTRFNATVGIAVIISTRVRSLSS